MAQLIRQRTLSREVPGSNLLQASAVHVVPLGKALYESLSLLPSPSERT